MALQRLDKVISSQTGLSRNDARKRIAWGRVKVNGKKIHDPSYHTETVTDIIEYDGQTVNYKQYLYLIMNKPQGILSVSSDKNRQTVVDLVPPSLKRNGLFPVGRLDKDTTGLLLLTDDGDFAHRVISPGKKISKTYLAALDGMVNAAMTEAFKKGVVLADGTVCKSAQLKPLNENKAEITITEGRYHQIKRMFGTVGLGVNTLHRLSVGGLALPDDITPGNCRELLDHELSSIFTGT